MDVTDFDVQNLKLAVDWKAVAKLLSRSARGPAPGLSMGTSKHLSLWPLDLRPREFDKKFGQKMKNF